MKGNSKRLVFSVPEYQYKILDSCAKRAGISKASLARSVMDIFLAAGVNHLKPARKRSSAKAV